MSVLFRGCKRDFWVRDPGVRSQARENCYLLDLFIRNLLVAVSLQIKFQSRAIGSNSNTRRYICKLVTMVCIKSLIKKKYDDKWYSWLLTADPSRHLRPQPHCLRAPSCRLVIRLPSKRQDVISYSCRRVVCRQQSEMIMWFMAVTRDCVIFIAFL